MPKAIDRNPYLYGLVFPKGQPDILWWLGFELHQQRGQHDVARIECQYTSSKNDVLVSGVPVQVKFGNLKAPRTWVGYYHTAENPTVSQKNRLVLNCLGATYPLAMPGQQYWQKVTATAVVKDLCGKRGLATDITATKYQYEQLAQAGITDWQLINRLATENGRFLVPDGTVIRFLSRAVIMARGDVDAAPYFYYNPVPHTRTVHSYQPLISDDADFTPYRVGTHATAGINPRTGAMISAFNNAAGATTFGTEVGAAIVNSLETLLTVHTLGEADNLLDGVSEITTWKYRLKATLSGDQRLKPGYLIRMLGLGKYTGTWIVEAVTHKVEFNPARYTCEVELVSNALGKLPPNLQNVLKPPEQKIQGFQTNDQYTPQTPPTVLRDTNPNLAPGTAPLDATTGTYAFASGQTRWQAQNDLP